MIDAAIRIPHMTKQIIRASCIVPLLLNKAGKTDLTAVGTMARSATKHECAVEKCGIDSIFFGLVALKTRFYTSGRS
jgi:hypothetical protein